MIKEPVPHHGGTPAEMLRYVADYLDLIDKLAENVYFPEGKISLYEMLNPPEGDELPGTVQADLLWLADQLEKDDTPRSSLD